MKHVLPPLPYGRGALEPIIDTRTMALHHGKHHAAYVTNLNLALEKYPELQGRSALWLLRNPVKIPHEIRTAVCNNAGGHVNHSLLWRAMSPPVGQVPEGPLDYAIKRDFGSLARFEAEFTTAGEKLFGSGWVWLVQNELKGGTLEVMTTSGHGNPLVQNKFPILVNDVWEHAYYLKHENGRGRYLNAWWPVVNWEEAARRFERADDFAEQRWATDGGRATASAALHA